MLAFGIEAAPIKNKKFRKGSALVVESVIPFDAKDGHRCNLIHVQGARESTRGPVLLVHGAGVRANASRTIAALAERNVDLLLREGGGEGSGVGLAAASVHPAPAEGASDQLGKPQLRGLQDAH